jgi:hypothetical protein
VLQHQCIGYGGERRRESASARLNKVVMLVNQSGVGNPALRDGIENRDNACRSCISTSGTCLARRCRVVSDTRHCAPAGETRQTYSRFAIASHGLISQDDARLVTNVAPITLHPHYASLPSAVACFLVDGSLRQYSHWVVQPRIPASHAAITRKVGMRVLHLWAPLRDRNALARERNEGNEPCQSAMRP